MGLLDVSTADQTLKQLQEVTSKSEDKTFRLRIARKAQNQMIPTIIGTLDGCGIEHLANPEAWLSQFAGGGDFFLSMSHAGNRAMSFGPLQVRMAGEPRDPDAFADTRPDWRGPSEIIVPAKPKKEGADGAAFISVGDLESRGAPSRSDRPQGSDSRSSASSGQNSDPLAFERMRLQQALDELARRERQASEDRHRQEIDIERKKNELAIEKLKAELLSTRPQGESAADKLLMLMREEAKQREEREEARRREERERDERRAEAEQLREEKRRDRDREDRKEREAERTRLEDRLAAERKAADERHMSLLAQLTAKPEVPAYVEKMLESKENAAVESARMMGPVMEMMGTSMNMMVQMMHNVAELNAPPGSDESPIFKLVGKVADMIQASAMTAKTGPMRVAPPRPPAPRPPAPPLSAVPPPAPAPAPAPAPVPVQPLAGLEPPPKPADPRTKFERLISAIKARQDPTKVVHFFFKNVNDPSIAIELVKADMQIIGAFAPHLTDWLNESMANQAYVMALSNKVTEIGPQYGAELAPVEPPEEEEEEGEEEEDGEEEGEEEVEEDELEEEPTGAVVDIKAREVKP